MINDDLEKVVKQLENTPKNKKPTFGIYDNGEELYIKSNKEGYDLFLAELIRARSKFDWHDENPEINRIELDESAEWKDPFSDVNLRLIVPETDSFEFVNPYQKPKTIKEKVSRFSVGLVDGITFILIAIIFIYGIYYLFVKE